MQVTVGKGYTYICSATIFFITSSSNKITTTDRKLDLFHIQRGREANKAKELKSKWECELITHTKLMRRTLELDLRGLKLLFFINKN